MHKRYIRVYISIIIITDIITIIIIIIIIIVIIVITMNNNNNNINNNVIFIIIINIIIIIDENETIDENSIPNKQQSQDANETTLDINLHLTPLQYNSPKSHDVQLKRLKLIVLPLTMRQPINCLDASRNTKPWNHRDLLIGGFQATEGQ